jgi:cbb3-type cytochrome oxidase subunit 3
MSSGLFTLFAMLAFIGISIWVFIIKNKSDFDTQAHMALEEDEAPPSKSKSTQPHEESSS